MKIYLVKDERNARDIKQLIKLNAECVKLHWSKSIVDIPDDVKTSLETIEEFVETRIKEVCGNAFAELDAKEEKSIISALKENTKINEILGDGVVFSGTQAKEVAEVFEKINGIDRIKDALRSELNVVLF